MKLARAKEEFMRQYFSGRRRVKKTETAYHADLVQFCVFAGEGKALTAVTKAVVTRWLKHLRQETYSPASVRRKMATLRVFCAHWARKGNLAESPFWRMELDFGQANQSPPMITSKEARAVLIQARRNVLLAAELDIRDRRGTRKKPREGSRARIFLARRDLAIVEVLRTTGMRVSEVARLDIGDLLPRAVGFKLSGAGGRSRLAYILDDSAAGVLAEYLKLRRVMNGDPSFFTNDSGSRLSSQGIALVLRQLCRQANVRQVTPSMFRNSLEQTLLGKGVDLRVVLEFLGKSSIPVRRGSSSLTGDHVVGELRKVRPSLRA